MEPNKITVASQLFVISGCSGGGKSSLIARLASLGYQTEQEPGRVIVREQLQSGGRGLPWVDNDLFVDLLFRHYQELYDRWSQQQSMVFFDRSLVDLLGIPEPRQQHVQAAKNFRYNRLVFLVPPWPEIYINDNERRHSFEDAVREYEHLLVAYQNLGYHVEVLAKGGIDARIQQILSLLYKLL